MSFSRLEGSGVHPAPPCYFCRSFRGGRSAAAQVSPALGVGSIGCRFAGQGLGPWAAAAAPARCLPPPAPPPPPRPHLAALAVCVDHRVEGDNVGQNALGVCGCVGRSAWLAGSPRLQNACVPPHTHTHTHTHACGRTSLRISSYTSSAIRCCPALTHTFMREENVCVVMWLGLWIRFFWGGVSGCVMGSRRWPL